MKDVIATYLNKTGQTMRELFSGGVQYGPLYIEELVRKALKENKKIVFVPELTEGLDLGLGWYELQDIQPKLNEE